MNLSCLILCCNNQETGALFAASLSPLWLSGAHAAVSPLSPPSVPPSPPSSGEAALLGYLIKIQLLIDSRFTSQVEASVRAPKKFEPIKLKTCSNVGSDQKSGIVGRLVCLPCSLLRRSLRQANQAPTKPLFGLANIRTRYQLLPPCITHSVI